MRKLYTVAALCAALFVVVSTAAGAKEPRGRTTTTPAIVAGE